MNRDLVESLSVEEAFKVLSVESEASHILNESIYKDTSGIMGDLDAAYSIEDLKAAWEEGKDSDPSMLEYGDDFDSWLEDTVANMTQLIDDESDEVIEESISDGQYCIVAITKDGDRKFYKDGEFIDNCKDCTVFTDLDEARDIWSQLDKSEFKRVFVPNWSENMFCEDLDPSDEEHDLDEDTSIDIPQVKIRNIDLDRSNYKFALWVSGEVAAYYRDYDAAEEALDNLRDQGFDLAIIDADSNETLYANWY